MDSFALRRPELGERLHVFELDHPATQALKRERLSAAGLATPPNLHFVPVDLEREPLDEPLARAGYALGAPAFVACLGVTPFLTRAANLQLLGGIAAVAASGSEVVFDYLEADAFDARAAAEVSRTRTERARSDEPWVSGFDPQGLPDALATAGLELIEDLTPAAAETRYCAGRPDGLRMIAHAHLACARVASGHAQ